MTPKGPMARGWQREFKFRFLLHVCSSGPPPANMGSLSPGLSVLFRELSAPNWTTHQSCQEGSMKSSHMFGGGGSTARRR